SNYVAPTTGTYFIQITVTGATRNVTYRLAESGLGGVDLAPSNLVIGPGSYQTGDEVRFAFDLANLRSVDVTAPTYEVYIGSATTPAAADELLGSFTAPNVAGNAV